MNRTRLFSTVFAAFLLAAALYLASGGGGSCLATACFPPQITGASATPATLWPPNHEFVQVTVSYQATSSGCGTTCSLSVSSNEPINGVGDGQTSLDWQVVDSHHVLLRAERSGTGNGRTYTITIRCVNSVGNATSQEVTVTVPHDKR